MTSQELTRRPRMKHHSIKSPDTAVTKLLTEEELDDDRFTYFPRRDEFAKVALLTSDASPHGIRYRLLDRVAGEDGVPEYLVRRIDASEGNVCEVFTTRPSADRSRGLGAGNSGRNSPSDPQKSIDIDLSPILRVSLYQVEEYVSAREIERFENERYKYPRGDDLPYRISATSTSGSETSARATGRVARTQHGHASRMPVRPAVRRRKKRKVEEGPFVVIPRRVAASPQVKISASAENDEAGVHETGEDREEMNMVESIERDDTTISLSTATLPLHLASPGRLKPPTPKKAAKYSMMALAPPTSTRSTTESSGIAPRSSASSRNASKRSSARIAVTSPGRQVEVETTRHARVEEDERAASFSSSVGQQVRSENSRQIPRRSRSTSSRSHLHIASHTKQSRPVQGEHSPSTRLSSRHSSRQPPSILQPSSPLSHPADQAGKEEDEDFEISHIIAHDDATETRYYLVSWVGYSDAEATWMTTDDLHGAQEVLGDYLDELARIEGPVGGVIE